MSDFLLNVSKQSQTHCIGNLYSVHYYYHVRTPQCDGTEGRELQAFWTGPEEGRSVVKPLK